MTLPWQFAQLSADDQFECVRRLRAEGMGIHDIASLTKWSPSMIEYALDKSRTPRGRYEDWQRQKRVDELGGCSNAYEGIEIPEGYR
jgi:hypothetical protein